jgi:hypothetical protein
MREPVRAKYVCQEQMICAPRQLHKNAVRVFQLCKESCTRGAAVRCFW